MLVKVFYFLKKNLTYLLILYLVVQIIYVIFSPVKYQSDCLYYHKLAEQCIKAHTFYPAPQHLYEEYIIAPLYINLLIIVLSIHNSILSIGIMNIIFNMLQLFLLYKISEKLFDEGVAKITAVIYIFYLNNLGLVLLNFTELFFGVLVLASIYYFLKKQKYSWIFAGLFAGAAIAVRPLGWALVASYIIIYFYNIYKHRKSENYLSQLVGGVAIFIVLFGMFNFSHFGKFIYTATTGPADFIIGANNDATGAFNARVFEKGNIGYISHPEKMTYIEQGEYFKHQAINWIEHHPIKWLSLIPAKLMYMFLWDDISIPALFNLQNWDLLHVVKSVIKNKGLGKLMPGVYVFRKIFYLMIQAFNYLYYFLVVILIIGGLFYLKQQRGFNSDNEVIIIFCIIGTIMTMLVFGVPRFKYPYLIAALPFAAIKLKTMYNAKLVK